MNLLRANSLTLSDLLPAALMDEIRQMGRKARYADGQMIQQRGDAKAAFSIVESGQVLAGNVGADGTFLTAVLLNPEDHFGEFTLFAGLPRTQNLWAMGETVINHIAGPDFQALFDREPALPRALLMIALRRVHFLVEFLDGMRRLPLPVQIVHLLLTSIEDEARQGSHEVRCRQEDLAYMLGVSRVAVGKALKTLEADGLVLRRYGSIVLPDVQRLSEWVDSERQVSPIPVSRLKAP